jgi:hypothetical protein
LPIAKSEVQGESVEDFKLRVFDFLKQHHTQAYTITEIVHEVTVGRVKPPFGADYALVVIALEDLLARKEVSGTVIDKEIYFMMRD